MSRRIRTQRKSSNKLLKHGDIVYVVDTRYPYLQQIGKGEPFRIGAIHRDTWVKDRISLYSLQDMRGPFYIERFSRRPGGTPLTEKDFYV